MSMTSKNLKTYLRDISPRTASLREIIRHLGISEAERPKFRRRIREMAQEGEILRTRGRYSVPDSQSLVTGSLQAHPDGYAFLAPEEGGPDLFIGPGARLGALHGDRVSVRSRTGRKGREGAVVQILERARSEIVGQIAVERGRPHLVPLDKRVGPAIGIVKGGEGGARNGEMAVLHITHYPKGRIPARGKVVRVIGPPDVLEAEVDMVATQFDLAQEFPKKVVDEVSRLSAPGPSEIRSREDLRDRLMVTIDGGTAWDFDDAVSLERISKPLQGFRLGVHIADVSHYVRKGGALDLEARGRGTSVYFPGQALPMLPPRLSADLASLLPEKNRLALSVFIDYSRKGERLGYRLSESVVRVRHRLTYEGVARFLAGEPPSDFPRDKALGGVLRDMADLAARLRERRIAQGSLDFEIPQAEVLVDEKGRVQGVRRAPRTEAGHIIEDFMLAANQTVAEYLEGLKIPALYRVHEPPGPEDLEEAELVLHNLGYRVPGLKSKPSEAIRTALEIARGKPEEPLVHMALLRAMKLARYADENLGHFGLHFSHYTHFTSPIRRYPDLVVHRLLRLSGLGQGRKSPRRRPDTLAGEVATIALESSERERNAEAAARAMVDYKRARFMEKRVGEVFKGAVSGIVSSGFFVSLDDPFVEGFVRVRNLEDDHYVFDAGTQSLTGRRGQKTFRMGDRVTIRVARVDALRREIDFELLKSPAASGARRKGKETSSRPRRGKRGQKGTFHPSRRKKRPTSRRPSSRRGR